MFSRKTVSLLLLFIFIITFILGWDCQETGTSRDFNGGFEVKSPSKDEPAGWLATRIPQTKDFVEFVWDSTEYHSGTHSVSIAINSGHPQDTIAYNWTRTFADFAIGNKYSISGWIKAKDLKRTAWIVVQCWDADHKIIGFATSQRTHTVKGTTDWTQLKYDFTVPDGTIEVRVRAGISSPGNNGGKVWFDDIEVE